MEKTRNAARHYGVATTKFALDVNYCYVWEIGFGGDVERYRLGGGV